MRFLKKKLAKARENAVDPEPKIEEGEDEGSEYEPNSDCSDVKMEVKLEPESPEEDSSASKTKRRSKKREQLMSSPKENTKRGATSAKNIVKNYGRALANFASSNLALPYLATLITKEDNIKAKDFRKFIASKKKQARCIKGLRDLLIARQDDSQTLVTYKRIFQQLSVIFIKYFSVNWIFAGKLCDKITHLKYRFKILRRIQDPEHFTYLKGFC